MSAVEKQPPQYLPTVYNGHPAMAEDEISLVDLAKVLIRRRWWAFGTAFLVVLIALAYGVFAREDPHFQLITVYETAERSSEDGRPQPLQNIDGLIRRLETIHWPALKREFLAANSEYTAMPFELNITNASATQMIVLNTEAAEADRETVRQLHTQLVGYLESLDENRLTQSRSALETRLARVENDLADLQTSAVSNPEMNLFVSERLVSLGEQQVNLQVQLEGLAEGNILQVAAAGERINKGPGLTLLLALGVVLGGFIGLMSAFLVEFGQRVRDSLAEDKQS